MMPCNTAAFAWGARDLKTLTRHLRPSLWAALFALAPGIALAHPGHMIAGGWAHGFAHPFTGLDHILAMTSVGLLAFRLGGRDLWLVPLAFLTVMILGGALGMAHAPVPAIETGIAMSVIVLGAAVASRWRPAPGAAAALVGLFAIFHGYAHGAEMQSGSSGYWFGAGFVVATALLHGLGIGAAAALSRFDATAHRYVLRWTGAGISLCGVALLAGVL